MVDSIYSLYGSGSSHGLALFYFYVGSRYRLSLGPTPPLIVNYLSKQIFMFSLKVLSGIFVLMAIVWPLFSYAQIVHQDFQERVTARVIEVVNEYDRIIMGTRASTTVQELRIQLLSGEKSGEVVRLENDLMVLAVGDRIYVDRLVAFDGTEFFLFKDVERRLPLVVLIVVFLVLVVLLSGWQGARALGSLALSIAAILFILIPALLNGYSPALTSLLISGVILAATLFLTHGFKARVTIAFLGTFLAVSVTCLMAWVWVAWMRLTGFSDDASVYLNFATGGTLDLSGLLLGSIIIGLLGLLDDVSITQSSVVQELKRANPSLGFWGLYTSALRVGKDHVGSLVNTLSLAYVGAALPLILLYASSAEDILLSLNQEVIAAEILRIVVGSIGLVLAVPLVTGLAAWYFRDRVVEESADEHGHHHAH
jgi:uncharacterized membrane protein